MQIMKDAASCPGCTPSRCSTVRSNLTNVYVQPYYGMYNYAVLGLSSQADSSSKRSEEAGARPGSPGRAPAPRP